MLAYVMGTSLPDTLNGILSEILEDAGLDRVRQAVFRLERRLQALPERPMRRAVLVEKVRAFDARELVVFLGLLQHRSLNGQGRARIIMQEMALEPHVFQELPYERIQSAYAVAHEAELPSISTMFLSSTPRLNPTLDEAFTGNDHIDLPAGVRRSAARGRDRFKLDRLMHDRDHRVISILLENPIIIERDVVRIAAMRPTRPEVLGVIAAHPKWAGRYAVRKALAYNPYTPDNIAHRLLPTLLKQDLRAVMSSGVLSEEMTAVVRSLIRKS